MNKPTRYILLENWYTRELIDAIEKHQKAGWVCQGGICVSVRNGAEVYIQAMVK
jgi:hypothetical protein